MTHAACLALAGLLALGAQSAPQPPLEQALAQAATAHAGGRDDDAIRTLTEAAERLHSARCWMTLARLQADRHDAAALASLDKALAAAPNSEDVIATYARVAISAGRTAAAIDKLQPLVRMFPSDAGYQYLLGVTYLEVGDPRAADILASADRLEPGRPKTLLALGVARNRAKQYADAIPVLRHGLDLGGDQPDARAALAEAQQGAGQIADAEANARRVLSVVPDNATANLVVGMILLGQNDASGARAALERAVAKAPTSAKAQYQLSLACTRLGDTAAAQQHLEAYRKAIGHQ